MKGYEGSCGWLLSAAKWCNQLPSEQSLEQKRDSIESLFLFQSMTENYSSGSSRTMAGEVGCPVRSEIAK